MIDAGLLAPVPTFDNGTVGAADESRPRVFIDLSTSLSLFGQLAIGILRTEREIARRLLEEPRIVAIPIVFSGGRLVALDRDDALRLVGRPSAPETSVAKLREIGADPIVPAAVPEPAPMAQPTWQQMPIRAGLRMLARHAVAAMPAPVREDLRLVLIHSREIARKTLRAPKVPAPDGKTASPTAVGTDPVAPLAVPEPAPTCDPASRRMPVRAGLRKLARHAVAASPSAIREDLRLVLIHSREIVRKARRTQTPDMPAPPPAATVCDEAAILREAIGNRCAEIGWPAPGEVFWTCGHYGACVPLRLLAEARERLGFSCITICYDLIRNENPRWNPEKPHRLFYDCVATDLLDASDRSVHLRAYQVPSSRLRSQVRQGRAGMRGLTLGCDSAVITTVGILAARTCRAAIRAFGGVVNDARTSVSWSEFGKLLLDRNDFDLDLVLVGRAAEVDAAIREVEASPLLGRRIFWFDECSDDVLGLLYRQADALLYPSFAEGWGLPVSEALAVGTPVIASHAGAIPEAASGFATLLDPASEGAWRSAVLDIPASAPPRLPPGTFTNMDAAAAAVVLHVTEIALTRTA